MKTQFVLSRNDVSIIIIVASLLTFAVSGWNHTVLKGGDQWGYNAYLVATFINHDLTTLEKTYVAKNKEYGIKIKSTSGEISIDEAPKAPNGNPVLKYYYGVAFLQAPFFLITHLLFGGNGYTAPYVFAVSISCIFYVLLGTLLMFRLLKKFVSEKIAAGATLLFFFGSNLFYFTLCNPGMAHPYLFFLFSCIANCTYDFYKKPTYSLAGLIGFVSGLIIMTRTVEAIVLIIPVTYAIQKLSHFRLRFAFIKQHIGKLLLATIIFVILLLPQLLYWKSTSGQWIYDSYPGEGFDFLRPHIFEGLFSFKNGWFAYTPLMIVALLSIPILRSSGNPFGLGITLYLFFHIYITYSWKQWNYNAGLGSRPMVESYALLLIPFSICLAFVMKQRWKWFMFLYLSFCVYINALRTIQMQSGNFISEDATWQFNKQMLFKLTTGQDDIYAFDLNQPQPDTTKLIFVTHIGSQDFEQGTTNPKDTTSFNSGFRSGLFTTNEFNDAVEVVCNNQFEKCQYFRISLWANVSTYENHYRMGKVVVEHQRDGKLLLWKSVRIHNKLFIPEKKASLFVGAVDQWKKMEYYVKVEEPIKRGDVLKVYAWNPLSVLFKVDDISVDGFRKK